MTRAKIYALTLMVVAANAILSSSALAQFQDISAGLPGVKNSALAWADYDNDGDLDLTLGNRIYRNDGGVFADSGITLTGADGGALAWGDYDNDGCLDVAATTATSTRIYHNNHDGTFTDIGVSLQYVKWAALAWGDFNNDGRPDLVLNGDYTDGASICVLYRNDGHGVFTDAKANLPGLGWGAIAWGDYDGDGHLDLAMCGDDGTYYTYIYRNDGNGAFTRIASLAGVELGTLAWGDYDNDDDLDLVVAGISSGTNVYRNDSGAFIAVAGTGLPNVMDAGVAWGDYNHDGKLDLALSGSASGVYTCRVYRGTGAGAWVDSGQSFPAVHRGALAWGDYNNDGKLDLAMYGSTDANGNTTLSRIYQNTGAGVNVAPVAPTGLSATGASGITFSWSAPPDDSTPANGLSYNLRIGSSPGTDDLFCGMANLYTGFRRLPGLGNAQKGTAWTLTNLPSGTLYWSVQAIDVGIAVSPWAAEQSVNVSNVGISGYIVDAGGVPVAGVSVTGSNGGGGASTDSTGFYQLWVPSRWTGAVTPVVSGRLMTPVARLYSSVESDQTDQDYTAVAQFSLAKSLNIADEGALNWGDYDLDGKLDLAIVKSRDTGQVWVYHNDGGGSFSDAKVGLSGGGSDLPSWADYDNDGDLDLALDNRIFRNTNGTFADVRAGLPFGWLSSWCDYDSDGDMDLLMEGVGNTTQAGIFRNDGGDVFSDSGIAFPNISLGCMAAADYDRDGWIDLALRRNSGTAPVAVYRNNGDGTFSDSGVNLPGESFAWGDYNSDGWADLAVSGDRTSDGVYHTRVYRNNTDGTFTDVGADIVGVCEGCIAWGDFDNDGRPDLAITGATGTYPGVKPVTKVYWNGGDGSFYDANAGLENLWGGYLAWGDWDGDGKLDLAVMGRKDVTPNTYYVRIYRSTALATNTAPLVPSGLAATARGNAVTFTWNPGEDAQTPTSGLSHNIRVGTATGRGDVLSGMADLDSGLRHVPAIGNAQQRCSYTLRNTGGTLYWSVQTVDSAYAGSAWAAEESVTVTPSTISGQLHNSAGMGIGKILIAASPGGPTVLTDSNGYYHLNLPDGWTGTVTPSSPIESFDPPTRAYANLNTQIADQDFTAISGFSNVGNCGLPSSSDGAIALGDYDNDGYLDVACGKSISRNNHTGAFTVLSQPVLPGANPSAAAWGDYNNDGWLDLGYMSYCNRPAIFSNNKNGTFTTLYLDTGYLDTGALAWEDDDNNGKLDLAITGIYRSGSTTSNTARIYRWEGGQSFYYPGNALPQLSKGSLAWADYNNDGWLDLAISGYDGSSYVAKIYKRWPNSVLTDSGVTLPAMLAAFAWGDYDNDGYLDLAVGGGSSTSDMCRVHHNNGDGTFTDIGQTFAHGVKAPSWGDYNSDGRPDLLTGGRIYRNDGGGVFTDLGITLNGVAFTWGDCDNDGDLDIVSTSSTTTVYRNECNIANTPPDAPTPLASSIGPRSVTLNWSAATDAQTPSAGLSYNIRVGTAPGKDDLFCGMADSSSGIRRVVALGNAQKLLSWTLLKMPYDTTIYWSVQAIDPSYAGSAWAPEQTVFIPSATISGHIRTPNGEPVPSVYVSASNGDPGIYTNSQGYYQVTVNVGWSGTVRTAETSYPVDPSVRNYTDVQTSLIDQDFTTLMDHKISGYVRLAYGTAVQGVTLTSDPDGLTATTDSNGYYSITVPWDWSGTLAPSRYGNYFSPLKRSYANVVTHIANSNYTAGCFTITSANILSNTGPSLGWGDYDNDGYLDLAVTGYPSSKIYRNTGTGSFVDSGIAIAGVQNSSISWGDYNNDGRLDLAVAGSFTSGQLQHVTKIYKNDANGVLADIGADLSGEKVAWGDYDNDGDLDLAAAGASTTGPICKIYRNDNGAFVDSGVAMQGLTYCALAWADFDKDGRLDLAVVGATGESPNFAPVSRIYHNDGGGAFTDANAGLVGLFKSSLAWGDYDNDGYPDLAIAGESGGAYITKLYRNNNDDTFTEVPANLTGLRNCSIAWGDFDNDGDSDLLLAGEIPGATYSTWICRNDGGEVFTSPGLQFISATNGAAAWGDYNRDGFLDVAVSTSTAGKIYSNSSLATNARPTVPTGLSVTLADGGVRFAWSPATDTETPASGLTYNLRVGTAPGTDNVLAGASVMASGLRRVAAMGNAQENCWWSLMSPVTGSLYWSVQAVDSGFKGSSWAAERKVTLGQALLKRQPDGDLVACDSLVVTAVFGDRFYVESEDRTCGILIEKTGHMLSVGARVSVSGTLRTNSDGERYVEASTILQNGTGAISPLGLCAHAVGGGGWFYSAGTGAGQKGVGYAQGLNNVGLLIRTWGRVTQIGSGYLYIDDGSSLIDTTSTEPDPNQGLRIICDPTGYSSGDYLEVTGVSSCFGTPSGETAACIRVRTIGPP